MKKVFLILLLLMLVVGCTELKEIQKNITEGKKISQQPAAVQEQVEGSIDVGSELAAGSEQQESEPEAETGDEIIEDEEPVGPEKEGPLTGEDLIKIRVWIEKSPGKSEVSLNGGVEKFMVDGTDRDVIMFDLASKYDVPLKTIRTITEVVGESDYEVIKDETPIYDQEEQQEEEEEDDGSPNFIEEKDLGLIRAVGCKLSQKRVFIKIVNEFEEPIHLFRQDVTPIPDNTVRVKLNSQTLYEIDCQTETIDPGETVICEGDDVIFIRMQPNRDPEDRDMVAVNLIGYVDTLEFLCE